MLTQLEMETESEPISMDERLANALEAIAQKSAKGNPLSAERIVASVVVLIVCSIGLWVGTTVNSVSKTVIKLQANSEHYAEMLTELKTEVRAMRENQGNKSTLNAGEIALMRERMSTDDEREEMDITTFRNIEKRLTALETSRPILRQP